MHKTSNTRQIGQPIAPCISMPMTPIVIKGELHGVQKLKEVLDLFCGSNWTDYQLQQKHSSAHPSG
jgi:hypothetical protein